MLATLLQQLDDAPTLIATPAVAWVAIAPMLALLAGAVLLLVVDSLTKRSAGRGVYATATVLTAAVSIALAVPLWQRVQDADRGPFSTMAQSIGVDGFSVFLTFAICAAVIL